ncbi:uncharacterized protein LOC112096827 isoform X2 [Citrus clementina]|uniref:uncharacterized protein LOC112096827 isoform X2 n=1 Tax=Citrus clementina TaxID=85681 RepID=UPI000CED79E6|nr:uncharacterized protein LOC112096827 isoform X2 [Citrus x clementina]
MEVLLRPLFSIPSRTLTPPPPSPPHQSSHSQNSPFLPPLIPTLSKTLLSSSSRFLSPAPVRQAAQESQSSADVNADTREWFMQGKSNNHRLGSSPSQGWVRGVRHCQKLGFPTVATRNLFGSPPSHACSTAVPLFIFISSSIRLIHHTLAYLRFYN